MLAHQRSFLYLHLAILLAGLTGVLGRLISLNEGLLVWYRMLFSLLGLLGLCVLTGKVPSTSRAARSRLLGTGALVALHWVFFYGSIKYANVSVGLVCFSSMCFFTVLLEPLLLRRRLDFAELLLGFLVMVGIWIIFQFDARFRIGVVLGIISSLLAAVFTIFNKRWLEKDSPQTVNFYEMAGGCISLTLLLPIYTAFFPPDHWLPTPSDFGWLMVLSMLCTVLAIRLSLVALQHVSPFTVNLSYNLEPVYGILLAFWIYGENHLLGTGFFIGLFIIVLSVALQTVRVWYQGTAKKSGTN